MHLAILLLSIVLIHAVSPALPPSQCFSLQGSKYCKEYGQYVVPKNPTPWLQMILNNSFVSYPTLENSGDFDKMFDSMLLDMSDKFHSRLTGCGMNATDRYFTTILCTGYVQVSNGPAANENYRCGTSYPKMCSATLYEWYDSLERGVKDPNICRLTEGDRQASLGRISSGRDADLKVEWLTGSPPSCVDGKNNEDYKCGYLNEDVACKNQCPEAKCGQGQSGSRLLPSGSSESNTNTIAIIGGVVGGVAFIGLLGFAVYLRKQRGKDDPKLDLKNLPDLHSSAINSTAQTPMSPQSGPSYHPSPLFTPQPVDGYQQRAPVSSVYSPPLQPSPPSPTKQHYNQSLQPHNAASPAYISNESVSSVVKVATGEYLQPRNQDEIVVKKGDKVLIKEMFDDGWALGTNLSTGMEGIFPMSPFNDTPSSVSGSAASPTQTQFIPPNGPQHLQNQPQFQQNHPMRISETSTSSAGSGGGMPIYQVHNNLPQPQQQHTNSQVPAQSVHTPRPASFTPIQNQGQYQPQHSITSSLVNPNYQLYNYQRQQ